MSNETIRSINAVLKVAKDGVASENEVKFKNSAVCPAAIAAAPGAVAITAAYYYNVLPPLWRT